MEVSEWCSPYFHVGSAPIYPNLSCCLFGWIGFFIGFILAGLLYSFLTFIMLYVTMGFIQA